MLNNFFQTKVDVMVVFLHWGTEYMTIPNEDQRALAVILCDLGVKLVVASHPHVLQGHEWINDTLIHYSLGNFVFHPHFTFMGVSILEPRSQSIFSILCVFY